ncbi:PepSY domain-containing protein [Micromonospora sp. RP3T]|uniref:PepSY domain-containing protein n=1 Tax=Micromonospora sp. RP3T TaxID=2135446 RepID=UPI000D162364|nr:PepSY domain-containing protein [Micromonospora sp. RP3T]PTA46942.1 hypothetical protein C8054_07665 [Micromonospora sp. RP3T]
MTDHRATPEPHPADPLSADALGRVPEWLRQAAPEAEPTRLARWRIGLNRHSGKLLGGAVAVLLLACAGVVTTVGYQGYRRWQAGPVAHPTVSPPGGEQAVTSASPPPTTGPFDGTPAAGFPRGAAGIALPRAKRTGPFTEKQVADTLAKVRRALVTARLDRAFFSAKDPERLVRQFAPDARADLRRDVPSGEVGSYATRLTPGARLTADQPRVKGRISYRATRDPHGIRILAVTTNFVWAYAFPTASTEPGDGVVVVHDTVVWSVPHPDDVRRGSLGLWLEKSDSYASNIDCAAWDKGLLALGKPAFGGPVDPDPDAVFDPDKTLDLPDTC